MKLWKHRGKTQKKQKGTD
jgi:hypothetical protein